MMRNDLDDSDANLPAQAADWVEKISQENGEQYTAAAEAWCARSEHRREFLLAVVTRMQLAALCEQPYSLGLRGYRAQLHNWIVEHLADPASLYRLADEVHARLSRQRAERSDERVTALLYSFANELSSVHKAEAKPTASGAIGEVLERVIRELPGASRDALLLCSRDRLTHEEAAIALRISVDEVKRHLTQARLVVARKLSSTGFS